MEDPGGHEQPVGDSPSFFFSNGMKKLPIHWKQCVMKSDYLKKKKMGHNYVLQISKNKSRIIFDPPWYFHLP